MSAVNLVKVDLGDYGVLCLQEPYVFADAKVGGIPESAPAFYSRTQAKSAVLSLDKAVPAVEIMAKRYVVEVQF